MRGGRGGNNLERESCGLELGEIADDDELAVGRHILCLLLSQPALHRRELRRRHDVDGQSRRCGVLSELHGADEHVSHVGDGTLAACPLSELLDEGGLENAGPEAPIGNVLDEQGEQLSAVVRGLGEGGENVNRSVADRQLDRTRFLVLPRFTRWDGWHRCAKAEI
jgi:hypothetical protein